MAKYSHYFGNQATPLGRITSEWTRKKIFAIVGSFLPSKSAVMEIGPGKGDFARWCIAQGHYYVCYDDNPEIIRNAREAGAEIRQAKVPPLLKEDKLFDLVYLSHMFEHVHDSQQAFALMLEIAAVLKPGGKVLVFSPNFQAWGSDFWNIDYTHSFPVTPHRLNTIFADCGLQIIVRKRLYAHMGFFPGWLIDRSINAIAAFLLTFFPFNSQLIKAKTMFHQNLLFIAQK